MSYIPDHLTLKNGIAQSDFIQYANNDLVITTAGVLKIAGGSGVEASVLLSVAGTDPDDNPIKYTFPDVNIAMPQQDQIISFNSDGTSQFINNGGGGNPNAFINSQPLTVPATGSVLIADGAGSAFNSHPSNNTSINSEGIRLYGAGIQVVSVVGCDTRITQENDCNFNISNNSSGNIKLKCGGVLQVQGSAGGIYSLPNVNFSGPNQGDIISFNSDGTSEFIANGGGGGAVNAVLNTQYPTSATAGSVLLMSGGDAVSSSPTDKIIVDPDFVTVTSTGLTIRGNAVSGTSTIISELVGEFVISNKAIGGTMLLGTDGNITLETLANIDLNTANVNINKVEPKLNFNHTDFPTQQCNIRFQTNTEELIMEHFTPDDAARCNIRLGKPDINIETTVGLIPGNINLRTGGSGQTFINDYSLPNVNPTADGQLLSCNIDGESSWISPTLPQITYTYWVSNQGNDVFNGSIITPFATVGRAITEANTLLDTDKVVINVMAGQYNEFSGITITKNNITINGGTAIPSQTVFDGIITYAIDNTAVADIASSLYGLTVRGVVYAGSSANNGSYVLGACILGTLQSGIVPIVNSYNLAGSRDITVSNCVVYAYDTHALTTVSGRINATATLFTQSSLVLNNTSAVLEATGNGLLALFGCQCFSLNNQATNVPPIISLANTIAPSSSHTFNSCTIQYVFATVNTGTLNKVCIGCTNTVGISMLAYNNLLIGEGTRITNSGAQYVCISKQGAGSLVITYGQNLCGATANHYPSAASRTQLVTATN